MEFIAELWLPILASGVAVFVASSIAWMVLPHHQSDWARIPDEKGFTDALEKLDITGLIFASLWPSTEVVPL